MFWPHGVASGGPRQVEVMRLGGNFVAVGWVGRCHELRPKKKGMGVPEVSWGPVRWLSGGRHLPPTLTTCVQALEHTWPHLRRELSP